MYLMGSDEYECDICGFREKWDAHDDHRGDMWECERCGKHFCTNCFKKACGEEDFRKMLSETDNVLCPECWKNQPQKKEFSINIRETLETQVAVEAESEEAALREVERRWKMASISSTLITSKELTSGRQTIRPSNTLTRGKKSTGSSCS